MSVAASTCGQAREVGALERAVAADLGHHQGRHPGVGERPRPRSSTSGPDPSSQPRTATSPAPGVEPHRHRVPRRPGAAPGRGPPARRCRAPPGPRRRRTARRPRPRRAHAATGLHRHVRPAAAMAATTGPVDRARRCGPRRGRRRGSTARPGLGERQGLGHRVVAVDGLPAVVALVEAHAATAAQVDGGIEVHHVAAAAGVAAAATGARSCPSMRQARAARLLRVELGGPRRCPRSTAATTGPP